MRAVVIGVLSIGLAASIGGAQEPRPQSVEIRKEQGKDGRKHSDPTVDRPDLVTADPLWEALRTHKPLGSKHSEFVSEIAGFGDTCSVVFLGGNHTGQFEYHFSLRKKAKRLVLRFAHSDRVGQAVLVGFWIESPEGEPSDEPKSR